MEPQFLYIYNKYIIILLIFFVFWMSFMSFHHFSLMELPVLLSVLLVFLSSTNHTLQITRYSSTENSCGWLFLHKEHDPTGGLTGNPLIASQTL